MPNYISIVEIPSADFYRAVKFYKSLLQIEIEEVDMEGMKLGIFPGSDPNVQVINGAGYKPSSTGTLAYLKMTKIDKDVTGLIERNGGKVLIPKTEIGPEMGFYLTFLDSEGNTIGLHSFE